MEKFNDIKRPSESLINALSKLTSATASGELSRMGIKDPTITGPVTYSPGKKIIGPALTLQFLPIREDIYYDDEYTDPEEQLHRQVLYFTKPGDIVVVDARGSMNSGVFGEMMLSFFKGRGGKGIVIDGCIRDYASSKDLDLGLWMKGVTPNYHTQTSIFPYAVNVPISCGNTLVMPGDIIIADDDGTVVIPIDYAQKLSDVGGDHQEWEIFVKEKLIDGGHLKDYYPKHSWSEKIEAEYKKWLKNNKDKL